MTDEKQAEANSQDTSAADFSSEQADVSLTNAIDVTQPVGTQAVDDNADPRLPKKFLANDPDFVDNRLANRGAGNVLIPDGHGGLQRIDEQVVRIQHRGETVELIALPENLRRRRQRLVNAISILIGVAFVVLFFWLMFD